MQFFSQKLSLKEFVSNHRKEILRVFLFFAVVVIGVLGFWFALKVMLNTEYPILPVSSNSMCVFQSNCDSLAHPFEPTLHAGDLVIVQGVQAKDVEFAYPNSDILVFHSPKSDAYVSDGLVITRVVAKEEVNGTAYFRTKGDGVGVHPWPEMPNASECDHWYDYRENYTWNGMISEKLLVGKAVFRIPWIGYVALFGQTPFGLLIIVVLIIIILIVSLVFLHLKAKRAEVEPETNVKRLGA
jgi:hypothetical protein